PVAYKQYSCEISLPIYPQLSDAEIQFIIESVIATVQIQVNKPAQAEAKDKNKKTRKAIVSTRIFGHGHQTHI
ncbi:MAG: hypothetical protein ACN6PD_02545, partial [Sphingobacterium sp.]